MNKTQNSGDPLRIVGSMTGTSCDGLDAACLEFDADGWSPLWTAEAPYPSALRKRVLAIQEPGSKHKLADILALNRDLGDWYGETLGKLIKGKRVDAIANHGQTIAHHPSSQASSRDNSGMTLQSGDPTRIAARTGITCIAGFREGDMATGGQGAPLVPAFHALIAEAVGSAGPGLAIHNIGGISNLTYIDPEGEILAFDTGPGNAWIDAAASVATKGRLRMDRDGKLALKGEPDSKVVEACLKHPFLAKKPPKSTGRDDFPFEILLKKAKTKDESLVATAAWVTLESIARAYEGFILDRGLPLSRILLCGGGAKNPYLVEGLQARLPEIEVGSLADAGWDPQAVESQAFAYFGYLALRGKPIGGAWTGAKGFAPPAHVIPGKNWGELLGKLSTFR